MNVTLGRSACVDKECCPNDSVCIAEAFTEHFQYVKEQCDGKYMCAIDIVTGTECDGKKADYESVHYVCSSTNPGELTFN